VKTLGLSAALAVALNLTASTTWAAVIDFANALGPSGGYSTQAYYQNMLGGQPMTAAQQAYADQEDQLRMLGFLSESSGDFALGQMFYHIAYGITPPSPSSVLDSGGEGSNLLAPVASGGPGDGASNIGDPGSDNTASDSTGSDVTDVTSTGSGLTVTTPGDPGGFSVVPVPESSTWAMMLLGFAGLGCVGYRSTRKATLARARETFS
jgi:hypothetical protein